MISGAFLLPGTRRDSPLAGNDKQKQPRGTVRLPGAAAMYGLLPSALKGLWVLFVSYSSICPGQAYTHSKLATPKKEEEIVDEYYRAVRQLPSWLAQPLGQLPTPTAAQIHELRFRTGHGIFLTMSGRQVCLKELSECPQSLRKCVLDKLQLEEIFHTLCGGAVHAHQNELTQGFLTTPSGCRVGVAGRYVDRDGQMILQQVLALNLRIARAVPLVLPDRLCEILQRHFIGMLVVGEPDSGKTTFLRQIVQSLAGMQRRVCVVDERGEIYPPDLSGPDQQLPAVDTLSGIPKERAVQMALRTLSPQVIVLDELGSLAETAALEQGFFSGVDFIASVHAASAEEAVRRPQVKALQQQGMLRVLVVLQGCAEPGRVRQIDEL